MKKDDLGVKIFLHSSLMCGYGQIFIHIPDKSMIAKYVQSLDHWTLWKADG